MLVQSFNIYIPVVFYHSYTLISYASFFLSDSSDSLIQNSNNKCIKPISYIRSANSVLIYYSNPVSMIAASHNGTLIGLYGNSHRNEI